jgi:phage portal protein BeeE
MSFLGRAMGGRLESKALDASALLWQTLFPGLSVKSGVAVNIDTALRQSTVFACTRVLAEGIAQLPLKLYQERETG